MTGVQTCALPIFNIQKDTLYFSNFFNADVASNSNAALDTFPIHYHSLYKLNLIADRAMGIYTKYAFDNFDFIFKKDTARCYLQSYWDTIFSNDPAKYELVPRLTAQGINFLFEEGGKTYFFYGGGMIKPDRSKMDTTYRRRNLFCLTPCKTEEINGVAFGLYTKNFKNREYVERESLLVRSLAIELNPFQLLSLAAIVYQVLIRTA